MKIQIHTYILMTMMPLKYTGTTILFSSKHKRVTVSGTGCGFYLGNYIFSFFRMWLSFTFKYHKRLLVPKASVKSSFCSVNGLTIDFIVINLSQQLLGTN